MKRLTNQVFCRLCRKAKAIARIGTNYAKPLRVEDLAEVVGMGVSTLHHLSGCCLV
jgi:hypothetical protein